jgi:type IV pilus assembly protein PilB
VTQTLDKVAEFILDSGLVKKIDIEKANKQAEADNVPLIQVLLENGLLTEDDYRRVQAHIMGVPFVNLAHEKIDFETLSLIPEPVARTRNVIAYNREGDSLEVAMLDANDLPTIDFVRKKTGLKVLPRLTDGNSLKNALLQYQRSLKAEFGDIIERETASLRQVPEGKEGEVSEDELKEMAEDLPVVRIVDTLIKHAILQDASDIHIEPLEKELLVRYRLDGILHDAMVLPKYAADPVTARIKVLSKLKLDEKRMPQDGRFKVEMEGLKVSFRVSILPTSFGEKTVMRLLKENSKGFSLEGLGFHGEGLERIHFATRQKTGIILTTGPTGSGKTTTLYTVLDLLNTPDVNISTVEDPVEYQMPRINQTQIRSDIGFTFAGALRSLLRQDPDILMVGEIRDTETAELAVNAALTGHLVLSTLHTNSAAATLPRLKEMGVEPFLIVSTIKVIIGQRLVRRLCSKKESYKLTQAEVDELGKTVNLDNVMKRLREEGIVEKNAAWTEIPFYKPIESAECESGYKGRMGIHEVLKMSDSIKELMMQGKTADDIERQAVTEGMLTMLEDGIFKAAQGLTTIEEVLRVISE